MVILLFIRNSTNEQDGIRQEGKLTFPNQRKIALQDLYICLGGWREEKRTESLLALGSDVWEFYEEKRKYFE